MVNLLLQSSEERQRWAEELDRKDLEGTEVVTIVDTILRLAMEGRTVDHPNVFSALEGDSDRDLLTQIAFRTEPDKGPSVEDCLWACRRERLERKKRELAHKIGRDQQEADPSGANPQLDEQLAELQRLALQRDALQH